MADRFAPLAFAFLALHNGYPDFDTSDEFDRALYQFIETSYPKLELTEATVKHLRWSVTMLLYRRAGK